MKWFIFISFLFVYSCSGNHSASLSKDQQALFTLSNDLKKEYNDTNDSVSRLQLLGQIELRLQDYLRNSCAYVLDSFQVQMKKLEVDETGRLFAEFTDENCSYKFLRLYNNFKEMKADTVYQMVNSIKENTDIKLRFLCSGGVTINDPLNPSTKFFEIDAIPTAIK
jgi:hypothetical protein